MLDNFINPINQSDVSCETLYLNCNLILKHVLREIDFSGLSEYQVDEHLINLVIVYLRKLVNVTIKPTKLVCIVMDGIVPNTKVCSQRMQFYKHGTTKEFNSNMIAPGTVFMQSLHDRIYGMIDLKIFSVPVLFSDSNHSGESVFKIFEHIKKSDCTNIVIYGETGLIVNCMANGFLDIYICKNDSEIFFVKDYIFSMFEHYKLVDKFENNRKQVLLDTTLLFIMGGNVFVKACKLIQNGSQGFDTMIGQYASSNIQLISFEKIDWFAVHKLFSLFLKDKSLEYDTSAMHTIQSIDTVCNDYMNSIIWSWAYFVSGRVLSWTYKYGYSESPCIYEFTARLPSLISNFRELCSIDLSQGIPITPFAQLLSLLPRTCHSLLPSCFLKVMTSPSSLICKQYPPNETDSNIELPDYNLITNQQVVHSVSEFFTYDENKRNLVFI